MKNINKFSNEHLRRRLQFHCLTVAFERESQWEKYRRNQGDSERKHIVGSIRYCLWWNESASALNQHLHWKIMKVFFILMFIAPEDRRQINISKVCILFSDGTSHNEQLFLKLSLDLFLLSTHGIYRKKEFMKWNEISEIAVK